MKGKNMFLSEKTNEFTEGERIFTGRYKTFKCELHYTLARNWYFICKNEEYGSLSDKKSYSSQEKCNKACIKYIDRSIRQSLTMEYSEDLLGKEVYVTVSGSVYHKAKLLGYGAYSDNPNCKTFCVQVIKKSGHTFVDYFKEIYSKEAYDNRKKNINYPFGRCLYCEKEFNSELINEYNIEYCPWCGEKIDSPNGDWEKI